MSLLFRILYAAHANGTHHKLALDALQHMERADAESWRRVFLKNAKLYLEGSKAPDNQFKDFKNHVLHVQDGYWGGAPEKVEAWYGHVVGALRSQNWADAVYAAGVLSHYFTDVIHPFHTGQTEAENSIHRAVEWSINRSYDTLRALGLEQFKSMNVVSHTGAHWLKEMTCDGAEYAHRYYEKLIAHYDFKRGVVSPTDGLDAVSRRAVAELIMYATDAYGHILDRAIAEAAVEPPDVSLTLETVLATLAIPRKWVEKKLANAEDRRIVEAMYDELQATGRVEHTLPEDDRVIRDLYQREVLDRKMDARKDKRAVRIPDGDPADAHKARLITQARVNKLTPAAPAGTPGEATVATPAPQAAKPARKRIEIEAELAPEAMADPAPAPAAKDPEPVAPLPRGALATAKPSLTSHSVQPAQHHAALHETERRRFYLTAVDNLERAPSIGPKMAVRFADLGIKTVADFLAHPSDDIATLLNDRRLTGATIAEWQQQAVLVMEIAGLRGTHAQLMTGAGYRTAQAIAAADPVAFSADILKFVTTPSGKQILRDGHAPDVEKIKSWVEAARLAKAA